MKTKFKKVSLFGVGVSLLSTDEIINIVDDSLVAEKGTFVISGINAHAVVSSRKDNLYKIHLNRSQIVNIDGFSVLIALKIFGYKVKKRVTSPDLFYRLLNLAQKRMFSVYLLGSREEVVKEAANNLRIKYPKLKIAGTKSGYFNDEEEKLIIKDLQTKKPQMLFLALPSPKKEELAIKYSEQLGIPVILGVGGLFDIVAGRVSRAPNWMQVYGLEWLFRLIQEPKRMWRRYLIGNIVFVAIVIRQKLKGK